MGSSNKALGDAFEDRIHGALDSVVPGRKYRIAHGEAFRYSARINPMSGNRVEPNTDFHIDLALVRLVRYQPVVPASMGAEEIPVVTIEAKKSPTTDSIMAAAKKAEQVRLTYPWIRCGFVDGEINLTPKKLWHGRSFDFILSIGELSDSELVARLRRVVRREVAYAETGIKVCGGSHQRVREYPALLGRHL